ncbi:lytic murein transglycosylase [Microvirga tunisiensis]|jgi:lytic murein transglycosylase|uniref:Lytic murein transglycosylase n=1 Tax=Microvirga tunisiensis TaxID=2108360 RepID=A0A5N7MEU2_9HYPH|nr:lytic murein transglycosylase [Microvirga tunisiensis]MPR07157.1 lytic murein transglycosylase [Microvirga tunisiensis]MPR25405.1 lytic murein transglycosylase [Microvirga tunisiensis]
MQAFIRASFLAAILLAAGQAAAATCRDPAGFEKWLDDIGQEAVAQGISPEAVKQGLSGVIFDQSIIRKDRGQGVFKQSFEQFAGRMVSPARLRGGATMLKRHAATLSRIEQRFGVPAPVLVAIWGLETDFGAVKANLPVIRSVATLTYDCRRSDFFKAHLFDALRIVDSGDLTPAEMRGAWAGEMGQTQFMPSNYVRYAIDFDGDGRADLLHSPADVLASTANYLQGHGWVRGGDWEPGSPNFEAIRAWNKSQVYSRTIAYYASKLAGDETSASMSQ